MYTVKTGYQKLKAGEHIRKSKPSFSNVVDKMVWKVIWGLGVLSKMKNFMWRVYNNALPVGGTMKEKGD